MGTALLATGRIKIPYTVNNKTHIAHFYVRGLVATSAPFNINSRTLDANDILWTDAAAAAAQSIANVGISNNAFGTAVLEKLVSGLWIPQAYSTLSPTGAGATAKNGSQITIVLRDKLNHPVKVVILESSQDLPQHFTSPTGGDTNFDNCIAYYVGTSLSANSPFVWMVGRGNQYLNDVPFVGATVTLNRKLRRARGLA